MKVLHFYKTSIPDTMGGVEQVINQIGRGACKYNVNTEVLSLTKDRSPQTIEIDGYLSHRVKLDLQIASTGFSFAAFSEFKRLAAEADVIHYHFPWPFMDILHFLANIKKPTLVTYHSDVVRQKNLAKLYRPLMDVFLNDVDRIVATSPNYLASSQVLSKHKHKVNVIPIGLDKGTYIAASADRLAYWRQLFGSKFFLFIGVIRYYKGLHILMEAANGLDYPILIVGSGPNESSIKAQASKLGLSNVHFLGRLSDKDKIALLMLCYCVLLPSDLRSEAFGISLLEGAMFGKPMISAEIGTGTTFININDETGVVVPPGDSLSLRNAMRYLWENQTRAEHMGRNAEERYWKYFTADLMVRQYVELYHELVQISQS
jgi:glycosyltransferase involved in cell wall biosynthesis